MSETLNVDEGVVNAEDVGSVMGDVDVSDECNDLLCHNGQLN